MYIDTLTITALIMFAIACGDLMRTRMIRGCITKSATVNSQSEKTH